MNNILITGGCGFIGTNLLQRVTRNINNSVRVLDLTQPKINGNNFLYHFDDITDNIDRYFEGVDVVVHLACQSGVEASVEDPIGTFNQNVYGTLNCLEAARKAGVRRFIFASSGGTVLGKQNEPLNERLSPNPTSPYGASKLACEGYCKSYFHTYGLETVILRFSNVYGPYSNNKTFNLIPGFIMKILKDDVCFINGDGHVTKDYIYVEDLLNGIMVSSTLPAIGGEVFQLASGKQSSINDVVDILKDITKKKLRKDIKVKHRAMRVGDVSYECNISKAEANLLFEPMYDLEKGLELTFNWFMDNWK